MWPRPKESRDRRQEVDQQNREIAHADIVVTRAILARLEIATIGAKNFEFAAQTSAAYESGASSGDHSHSRHRSDQLEDDKSRRAELKVATIRASEF